MTVLAANRASKEFGSPETFHDAQFTILNAEIIWAGGMVVINPATLEIDMAADTALRIVLGVATRKVDNTLDGEVLKAQDLCRGIKLMNNSAGNALTNAHVDTLCFVEDDNIVSSDPGTNSVIAGRVHSVVSAGVWVDFAAHSSRIQGLATNAVDLATAITLVNEIKARLQG